MHETSTHIYSTWSSFLHSLLSIGGTVLGFILIFFLVSLLANLSNKFSKLKPKYFPSILPDAEGQKKILSRKAPLILQMNITGVIGQENLNLDAVETQLIESQIGDLENRVKAILLKINSPGGSATDSDAIYRRLKTYKEKYKIPIYAYVDGICASGAMFAACAADRILSSPSSIIGSIGVRLMYPFLNVSKLLEKWEVGSKTFAAGKHKDHLNPFRPWQEGEDSDLKHLLEFSYNRFVNIVSTERKISREKLIEEYGAQIFPAPDSVKIGLIDDATTEYDQALAALAAAAQIQKPYQVIELVKKRPWFREMVEKSPLFTGKIKHEIPFQSPDYFGQIAYLP